MLSRTVLALCMVFIVALFQGCTTYVVNSSDGGVRQIMPAHHLLILTPIHAPTPTMASGASIGHETGFQGQTGRLEPCWRQMIVNQGKTIFIRC
jgi:hypothetical protein